MAKSQIIKDLANSTVDTLTALKRAKVLFSELGNDDLLNWANYEIVGYPNSESLPDYRISMGILMGSYIRGSMSNHIKYNNVPLPLGQMPDDIKGNLLSIYFSEGVNALKQLLTNSNKSENQLGKTIPSDFYPLIARYNNDPYMVIYTAQVVFGSHLISDIISSIENRLLDAFILLEKEFGVLDDLELDATIKTPQEIKEIADKIIVIIYNDNSVKIGDNNKIKNTTIASVIEKQLKND